MAIEPATLPQALIDLIGEYGLARTDGVGEIERLHRWELLIAGIKDYTASQMREHEARVRAEAPTHDQIYGVVRGTGYVTHGQAHEITELLLALIQGDGAIRDKGADRG